MKKLIYIIFTISILLTFTSCQNKETNSYTLSFVNSKNNEILDYTKSLENHTTVDLINFQTSIKEYLLSMDDLSSIDSVFVYNESLDEISAIEIINILKPYNIPVFFAFAPISDASLNAYDKAYNFTLDYNYLGELLAKKADDLWTNSTLDANGSLLLEFFSIGYMNPSEEETIMYNSFVRNIELLGIPYSILSEEYIETAQNASSMMNDASKSEIIFVLDNELLNDVYPLYTNTIPIISHNFSINNNFADNSNVLFIDYKEFFNTGFKILENIENKSYPFLDVSLYIKGKTIYLSPEI